VPETDRHFPDLEVLVLQWLGSRTTALPCTERPKGEAFTTAVAAGGIVQVERAGGAGEVVDRAISIELGLFAPSRAALWILAAEVESAMADLTADGTEEGFVDAVEESFLFAAEPHPDPAVRYATGTFTLTVRPV
jgi:hypothetical protein